MAGRIYPQNFIGPTRPQDQRAQPGFIGPTYSGPNNVSGGSVMGASTGGGGGGGSQPQSGMLDQIGNNTRSIYDDQLNRARSLYDARAGELNNQLEGLGREKDAFLDRIGSTYRGLTQTAQDTLQKNLGALDNRRAETEQTYDVNRTNVGRLLQDQMRMNRVLGRAQGTLGSSYYGNIQTGAGREATQRVAGLNTEEQGKLDAIGDAILNAQTDTNSKLQALEEEKANQERETINKYTTLANAIRNDLRFNERDKLDALDAVNNRMSSALDQINLTMLQYQSAAGQLGNTANTWSQNIQGFNPFGQIQSTLDTNTARTGSVSPFQSAVAPVTPAGGGNDILGFLNRDRDRQGSYLDQLFA